MVDSTLNKAHVEEYYSNEGIQYVPVCLNSWNKSLLQMLKDSGAFHNIDFGIFFANHHQEEDALVNILAMFGKKRKILLHFEANDYFPMHEGGMRALYNVSLSLRCTPEMFSYSIVET